MRYGELEDLKNNTIGRVCLFGAGLIGSTWAYDILKAIGFRIEFYCDNNKAEGTEVRDGIKTVPVDVLYLMGNSVVVFITVAAKYQESIKRQLESKGIKNTIRVDYLFMQEFIESLIEIDDKELNERFKAVLDDAEYLKRMFLYKMGEELNLEHPITFNEKLQWLKLHRRNPNYTKLVDKFEAKKYAEDRIGKNYIIPTLGIYDNFDEINFDNLPKQFVLKCTHDSGSIVICNDKDYFDKEKARTILAESLKLNYFWRGREYPYKDIVPRIIAEKYIEYESGSELIDYKFMCFNGKVRLIFTCSERFSGEGLKVTFFDTQWNKMPFERHYPSSRKRINKPKNLEKMVKLSEALSCGIDFVRVDFYEVGGQVYLGEMTFFPGGGTEEFTPREWDIKLGEWIRLPKVRI